MKEGGESADNSIEVRFNDGSLCDVSGTMRIILPSSEPQAIALISTYGYMDYKDLEQKLVLPVVRNALRLTSNLMSARESYSEQRADFVFWTWDQVQNGNPAGNASANTRSGLSFHFPDDETTADGGNPQGS